MLILSDKFIHQAGDLTFFYMAPGFLFRIEQFAVNRYFKSPAVRRDKGDRFDFRFELLEKFRRQTGGSLGIVSNSAVFDAYFQRHESSSWFGIGIHYIKY